MANPKSKTPDPFDFPDVKDRGIARLATDLIEESGAFALSESDTASLGRLKFEPMRIYLRDLRGEDPDWTIVRAMYEKNPDAALNSAGEVYFELDKFPMVDLERKKLTILLLSYDLANEDQRGGIRTKAIAQLSRMAKHPHWCVRAYALAVMKTEPWAQESSLLGQLSEDRNPMVSAFAKEILADIKGDRKMFSPP